jgi:uncharacterized protein YcfL
MKSKILVLTLPLLALFFSGCDPDSPVSVMFSPPQVVIDRVDKVDAVFPYFAKIVMTVRNSGSGATAYSIECVITLKQGNMIIDRGVISYGDLKPGESIRDEAWFNNIKSHSEYTSIEYHLFWYDSQGNYYD